MWCLYGEVGHSDLGAIER